MMTLRQWKMFSVKDWRSNYMQDKFKEYLEDCAEVGEKIKSIREDERRRFLNKACEILKNTIDDDVLVKCGSVIKCMNVNEFVEYFCKAMEK